MKAPLRRVRLFVLAFACACSGMVAANVTTTGKQFWHFESGQVRPLALSPDKTRLFAVNTPDNHLEVYVVTAQGLQLSESIPVGLEPVAVAARSNNEVWVVNHLSDSISIIDVSTSPAKVVRTLLVGDEPRDIVFAGVPAQPGDPMPRAFITTAHRGQNVIPGGKYGDFLTPGIGRADVWVFAADSLGASPGGSPETIITLFGDTPRALAVTADGASVYAGIFHSGNKTTIVPEQGAMTTPNANFATPPEIPTIVQFDGSNWIESDGTVNNQPQLLLPDYDVFKIDATASTPVAIDEFSGVGTILFNIAVHPTTGKVYITNTDANNLTPNEPDLTGNLHRAQITMIDGIGNVAPRHLNKHINYAVNPAPASVRQASLATPMGMEITSNGVLYVTAFGSSKVGRFTTAELDNDSFVPSSADQISVSGGGPSGLAMDEANQRLYVLTRFDNGISVIDMQSGLEIDHFSQHNPEPASVTDGRRFLYDAIETSSNGEASCAACHIFGQMDSLAWDLSDNLATDVILNPNLFNTTGPLAFIMQALGQPAFHPMKGPMTTQSLRGMNNHGPMHWRGDRSGALVGGSMFDEDAAFKQFNPAFVGLLGRSQQLGSSEMQAFTDFILQLSYPPNPIRNLDNSLTSSEQAGSDLYHGRTTDGATNCNGCHVLAPAQGFFGTDGRSTFEGAPQLLKVAHLRNMYQKVGMFGAIPQNTTLLGNAVNFPAAGPVNIPQIRGFGFTHNGTVDTLVSFLAGSLFSLNQTEEQNVAAFILAYPNELAPIVGQQITLDGNNQALVSARIQLMIDRAGVLMPNPVSPQQKECDLVVNGLVNGTQQSWLYDPIDDLFYPDSSADIALTDAQLQGLVFAGDYLTYTCAPPGSGPRIALDRDLDTLLNRDELVKGTSPASVDTDNDGVDDASDNCPVTPNPSQADTGSINSNAADGIGDACQCGDINGDGKVSNSDAVLIERHLLGLPSPFDADFCDTNGDGSCTNTDSVIIKRTLLGLPPGIKQTCSAAQL